MGTLDKKPDYVKEWIQKSVIYGCQRSGYIDFDKKLSSRSHLLFYQIFLELPSTTRLPCDNE